MRRDATFHFMTLFSGTVPDIRRQKICHSMVFPIAAVLIAAAPPSTIACRLRSLSSAIFFNRTHCLGIINCWALCCVLCVVMLMPLMLWRAKDRIRNVRVCLTWSLARFDFGWPCVSANTSAGASVLCVCVYCCISPAMAHIFHVDRHRVPVCSVSTMFCTVFFCPSS